uniref:RING-type domain-containing protein n=1 Tax=Trichobilharzia regenti TaxID=157069 RepID=A0AA85K727_TRIRE|nr:unnamed protein product [Trichobilharzia regenti]
MRPQQMPPHYRGTSHIPVVQRMPRERNNVRVTLDKHVVNDNHSHLRMNSGSYMPMNERMQHERIRVRYAPPRYTTTDGLCYQRMNNGSYMPMNERMQHERIRVRYAPPRYTTTDGLCYQRMNNGSYMPMNERMQHERIRVRYAPPRYTTTDGLCYQRMNNGSYMPMNERMQHERIRVRYAPPRYTTTDGLCYQRMNNGSYMPMIEGMLFLSGGALVATDGNFLNDGYGHRIVSRLTDDDPVLLNRSRLHQYESDTHRHLSTESPSSPEPSGLTRSEFESLPFSLYKIKQHEPTNSGQAHADYPFISSPNASICVPVIKRNQSSALLLPGTAYLQPESKSATLFDIQPIQSSPSTGRAECEICLNEYEYFDQLRHLPCGHAFHEDCIDVWLRESTTCPKCRGCIRTELTRLELARLDVRDQSNNVTSAAVVPVGAVCSRVCGSNSGAQQQIRTTN